MSTDDLELRRIAQEKVDLAPKYDLGETPIDWGKITTREEEKGRWSFTVKNREEGRKIAFEYIKLQDWLHIAKNQLENSTPIRDCRLDSNQISFMEYDEELDPVGEIQIIEIFMRYGQDDGEYYNRYMTGIDDLRERIEEAKKSKDK